MNKIVAGMTLIFLSACAPQAIKGGTEAVSYRYPGQVGKHYEQIVVFVDLWGEPGLGLFVELSLCREMERYGRLRRTPVFCTPKSALQGSQRANADAIIEVKLTSSGSRVVIEKSPSTESRKAIYTSSGEHASPEWANFIVKLTDTTSNEVAWTAAVFTRSGTRGDIGEMTRELAHEVTRELWSDELLPGR